MDAARERAFEEFVRGGSERLFRTAYLLAGDRDHAQDLLQSALERVYRRWDRVEAMEHREAYVRRTMVNLTTDRWRRRRYLVEVPFDERAAPATADPTGRVDLRAALVGGLLALPPAMRTVVVLRHWEGLSEAEVADEVGCSLGTVKSQASRGLARLRDLVDGLTADGRTADGPAAGGPAPDGAGPGPGPPAAADAVAELRRGR